MAGQEYVRDRLYRVLTIRRCNASAGLQMFSKEKHERLRPLLELATVLLGDKKTWVQTKMHAMAKAELLKTKYFL